MLLLALQVAAVPAGRPAIADALDRGDGVSPALRGELLAFYAQRDFQPLWFGDARERTRTAQLLQVLGDAAAEGLDSMDYLSALDLRDCADPLPQDLPGCELGLSDALLRYAQDVGYGVLTAAEADPSWHIPQARLDVPALLRDVAGGGRLDALLQGLPPPHRQYARLRSALAEQLRSSADGPQLAAGPSLRPGDRNPRVATVRERLAAGDARLSEASDAALFDAPLKAAVRRFQARHGLVEDGIVGRNTRAALNLTRAERLARLRLNMERWRWLPRDLGAAHVLVNLAGFELTLVQPDKAPQRLRVINGRTDRSSPAMQAEIRRLVINPDWTVPRRMAVEDMLPQLREDPNALRAKQISVLQMREGVLQEVDPETVDWQAHHRHDFPYILRQAPGPGNSLGRIKFDMPNALAIYLHDTPAKALFGKQPRAFSSGCVRVEQPLQLAAQLVGGDAVSSEARLQGMIDGGETEFVPLVPAVPVYLVYLTAWVDDAGNLQLRDDVYGRNVQLRDRFTFPWAD